MDNFMDFGESAEGGANEQFDFGTNDQINNFIGTGNEDAELDNQFFQQNEGIQDNDLFGDSNSNENTGEVDNTAGKQDNEEANDEEENVNNREDIKDDEGEDEKEVEEAHISEDEARSSLLGANEDNKDALDVQMQESKNSADEDKDNKEEVPEQDKDVNNGVSQLNEPVQKVTDLQENNESSENSSNAQTSVPLDIDGLKEKDQGAESVAVENDINDLGSTATNKESLEQNPVASGESDKASQDISSIDMEHQKATEESVHEQSLTNQVQVPKDPSGSSQNENLNSNHESYENATTEQKSNSDTTAGGTVQKENNFATAKSMEAATETILSSSGEEIQNASTEQNKQTAKGEQLEDQIEPNSNKEHLPVAPVAPVEQVGNTNSLNQDNEEDADSKTEHEISENTKDHTDSKNELSHIDSNNESNNEAKEKKELPEQINNEKHQHLGNPSVPSYVEVDKNEKDVDMDNENSANEHNVTETDPNHAVSSVPIKISNSESSLKSVDLQDNDTPEPIDPSIPQIHDVVIPSYSCWFDLTKIHSIEKENLPEFFTNRIVSKTPQIYMKYRNFMVNTYRISPDEYFTFTSARRNLCGDSGCIFRIHKFLNRWGLINYQVDAQKKPANIIEPPSTKDFEVKHDAPRGLFPFQSYKPSVQLPDLIRLKKLMNQELQKSNSAEPEQPPMKKRKTSQGDEVKVENQSQNNVDINTSGSTTEAVATASDSAGTDGWSAEEETKLVKLISDQTLSASKPLTSDIWVTASHLLGNKTPQECILKFLQLPLEDPFLMSEENGSNNGIGPLKYAPYLPFSKADNPVLSTIAFLVGLCDPSEVKKMVQHITKDYDTFNDNNKPTLKDGVHFGLSALGIRARHFADNGEKELLDVTNRLVHAQMQKVDLKLEKLKVLEKSLTLKEHYFLQERQKFVFEKLQFYKEYEKLMNNLGDDTKQRPDLRKHLDILAPNSLKPVEVNNSAAEGPDDPTKEKQESSEGEENIEDSLPISVSAPQFYRYWSG
ncbi:hypothetical protein ACO0QE_002146 [Hanseniaspora vineae]